MVHRDSRRGRPRIGGSGFRRLLGDEAIEPFERARCLLISHRPNLELLLRPLQFLFEGGPFGGEVERHQMSPISASAWKVNVVAVSVPPTRKSATSIRKMPVQSR